MGASEKENKPEVHYWHVWTDENGISRQTRAALTSFEKESMGGDADQQWNNHLLCGDAEVLFTTLPVGWKGSWHENPKPQWIIPLSGKWFVETMDGHRVEMCRIECLVEVKGDLTEVQKYQLLEIAYKCPVHRTLHSKMYVQTNISIIS